ncbi:MAG: error-prone DNA polymerase [Deltaproteobacteria bacterium]|nr:error-prone DNA polymerase [Deltaproteobacteria bacterium]
MARAPYVELRCRTAFSFLRGASHPEELADQAAALGYDRVGICDDDGLYGVARTWGAAQPHGLEVLVGAELHLSAPTGAEGKPERGAESPSLALLAMDRAGYARLSRLLTLGRRRVGKGGFALTFEDLAEHAEGLYAIHAGTPDPFSLSREKELFGERLALAVERAQTPFDRTRIEAAHSAAARFGIPLVATGSVVMHAPERKPLQDILSCVRLGLRLDEAGRHLLPNRLGYLKAPEEMVRLFADMPEAIHQSVLIADQCGFRLDEIHQSFALEVLPDGETGMSYLWKLVNKGATERYPEGVPEQVQHQLQHEMAIIEALDFSGYFLTVWDIVRFARSRNILCQGRGSAANSIVCYCLGITAIDPVRMNLLFERFISAERGEPPDIDVDFEHERREEVIQYIYEKYDREHAAMVANVICYRTKLAYREVGKVFGLGEDQIDKLTSGLGHWADPAVGDELLAKAGLDPRDEAVQQVVRWAGVLVGFPRHLGIHSGGFVITRDPLVELVPVENATMEQRTIVAWDKRDVERLGLVKIDLLALGMLTTVHRAFDFVREHEGLELDLAKVPSEVPEIYAMICDADTVGTFQVESRAQMQMLPRLRPKTFYDLVVSVAIVRPGPIQGDMVHPYLRRREGLEPVEYPHPAMEAILHRTHGVPLFQEQVMKIAVAVAGFKPGEADELRRAIGWSSKVHIDRLRERLIAGMEKNGLAPEFAERIFRMIQGFGGYGFPESHAASFALISYASCYLKRYHPAAFLAALLNSQPMGFYSTHTLVADAQRHGVLVKAPCVQTSGWDAHLEAGLAEHAEAWWQGSRHKERRHTPWADREAGAHTYGLPVQPSVRLGLREVLGMSEAQAEQLAEARRRQPFEGVADLVHRAELPKEMAAKLAAAGTMACFGLSRRQALWRVMALDRRSPLFAQVELPDDAGTGAALPEMSATEAMRADYGTLGLSVSTHPMALVRDELRRRRVVGYLDLVKKPHGAHVRVGGMMVTRQRPGTASGVVFMTLEDEDGHMNLVVFTHVYERYRDLVRDEVMLIAEGEVQRQGRVVNLIVQHFARLEAADPGVSVARSFF